SDCYETFKRIYFNSLDEAQTEPEGAGFELAVHVAHLHVRGPDLYPVAARVLDDRRRGVETKRLAVEERACESRWMVGLEPARHEDREREAGGVRFGKTVLPEALDLLVDLLRVFTQVAALEHAVHELVAEGLDAAAPTPRRHRAAKLVRFSGREARRDHR